ncbi:MAG: hypothetical protein ACU0DW_02330 [Shimia sp.]
MTTPNPQTVTDLLERSCALREQAWAAREAGMRVIQHAINTQELAEEIVRRVAGERAS